MRRSVRGQWRWGALLAVVGLLVALPSVVGARPVSASGVSAADLLARVRASAAVGWSGYGESRGSLVVPDVQELAGLPSLVGDTTRTRAWWRGSRDWRVDALTLAGENDVAQESSGTYTWSSADRAVTRLEGQLPVRLPTAADLVAPVLGRRLAGTTDTKVRRLPARRVAGHDAPGLRLLPDRPERTTVASVDLWAEPRTGLPLRVEVHAKGAPAPALTALLLDVDLRRPPAERTDFVPPADAALADGDAPDLAALADRFAPYRLPDSLAGLARTDRVGAFRDVAGVGTYGGGFASFAVVPLPRRLAGQVIRKIAGATTVGAGGETPETAEVATPLLNGVVGRRGDRGYLVAGTVPVPLLRSALDALFTHPPPQVR